MNLNQAKALQFYLKERKKGYSTGFTENYVKVRTPWDPKLVNTLQEITLETIDTEGYVRFSIKA